MARILYPSCCWGARILGPQRPCPRGQSAQFATHPTTQSASLAATKQKADFQTIFLYWCCPMPPLWHQCSNVGWPWPPPGQDPRGSHWIRALWARIQGGDPRGMCTGSKLSTWQGCRSEQPPQNCSDSAKAAKAVCKAASCKLSASCAATRQGHWGVAPAPSWPTVRPGGQVPQTTNCEVQGHQQRMPRVALCCMIVQHFFGWAQCWGLPTGVLGQHMHTVAGSVAARLLVLTVHCWGPRCHRWWQLILCMIETFGF